MKKTYLLAVLVGVTAFAALSSETLAFHSPRLGRFLQRDPLDYVDGMGTYEYVRSNPIIGMDPTGTDLYIQGHQPGTEPFGHQSVGVGDPKSPGDSYSFGVVDYERGSSGGLGLLFRLANGEVYLDRCPQGVILARFKTTPEEDAWIKQKLNSLLGTSEKYSLLLNNCSHWSQRQYLSLIAKILKRRMEGNKEEKKGENKPVHEPQTEKPKPKNSSSSG
ncbi:MAG: hypothetical protein JW849_00155 [Phycisphaerae bacterium]|nr:hypothetical protein [Phycisphaerae bacterium]